MRRNLPKVSTFEKAMAWVAPGFATRVYQTRAALAMADSYSGGSRTRRATQGWSTSNGDADADILQELSELRERSRDLVRNNAVAGAAISTKVTSVVGTGLSLQARVGRELLGLPDEVADQWESQVEAEFDLWSKGCDATQNASFLGLQDLIFRSVLENGDVLISTPSIPRPRTPYQLSLQLIEADRVCNPSNTVDTMTLSGGVERDIYGAPTRYHVLKVHPGYRYGSTAEWMNIPAYDRSGLRRAFLLYHKIRVGQNRGVPDLAPVIELIKQLGRYTDSESMAAVVSSFFTVFVKTEGGDGLDLPGDPVGNSNETQSLGNGNIIDLAPGEDIQIANPARPNPAFEPFVLALSRQIGARLELPFEILTKHFTSSYSASRAALLEAWRYYTGRREWLTEYFCRPVYELFLTEAVATGRISAPGFLSGDPLIRAAWLGSDWIGDAPGQIDETKAVTAAKARIDAGLSNEDIETTALTGRNRDDVYRQRKKEIEQRRADDMMIGDDAPPPAPVVQQAPEPPEKPEDDGDEDE